MRLALPRKKRYGIDLDGCCFNFLEGFAKYLGREKNIHIDPASITDYYWTGVDESLKEKIWKVYFHDFCRAGGMRNLSVISGAAGALKLLNDMGNELFFVTSRETYVEQDTIDSIEEYLEIKNPSVHIVTGKIKSPYVKDLKLDVFIDDSPSTLTDLITNTRAQVYIMDYPYNRSVDAEALYSRRVSNWQEFIEAEGWMQNVGR
jgi:uncharacterized HAD superfamily protein